MRPRVHSRAARSGSRLPWPSPFDALPGHVRLSGMSLHAGLIRWFPPPPFPFRRAWSKGVLLIARVEWMMGNHAPRVFAFPRREASCFQFAQGWHRRRGVPYWGRNLPVRRVALRGLEIGNSRLSVLRGFVVQVI